MLDKIFAQALNRVMSDIDASYQDQWVWWEDPVVNYILIEAINRGMVMRPSITQVEWTEYGVGFIHHKLPEVAEQYKQSVGLPSPYIGMYLRERAED